MKKTITLSVLFLIVAFTSLEAGVRVRPCFGFNFGTTYAQPCPVVYTQPVYVAPAPIPVYPGPVAIAPVPGYYQQAVVYPVPVRQSYSGFSFGCLFR